MFYFFISFLSIVSVSTFPVSIAAEDAKATVFPSTGNGSVAEPASGFGADPRADMTSLSQPLERPFVVTTNQFLPGNSFVCRFQLPKAEAANCAAPNAVMRSSAPEDLHPSQERQLAVRVRSSKLRISSGAFHRSSSGPVVEAARDRQFHRSDAALCDNTEHYRYCEAQGYLGCAVSEG